MKLYKVTRVYEAHAGHDTRATAGWATSDSAASKICTALKKADRTCEPEREEIEIDTRRTELVTWLNVHVAPAKLVG